MAETVIKTKKYSDTYLYNVKNTNYEKILFESIMKGEEINKLDPSFEDIKYEVKKRLTKASLVNALMSKNVILLKNDVLMPRAFKVFAAKDVKNPKDQSLKAFIDADVIIKDDGKYKCTNYDILVAYTIQAITNIIYYGDPKKFLLRAECIKSGAMTFAKLFTYIVDYLCKISSMPGVRDKCLYMSSLYYQINILGKDMTDSVKSVSRNISGISEREADMIHLRFKDSTFLNINYFIETVSEVLRLTKITLESFLTKWCWQYGPGTQFALELFPAFAAMCTNVYTGSYLNQQKTIEKIAGRDIVDFASAVIKVGEETV